VKTVYLPASRRPITTGIKSVSLASAFTQEEHMRKGQKVETLTKTVGQTPRTGVVIDLREEDLVEVEWEDGHTSIVTRSALIPTSGSSDSQRR
jgi:hypothetical protein